MQRGDRKAGKLPPRSQPPPGLLSRSFCLCARGSRRTRALWGGRRGVETVPAGPLPSLLRWMNVLTGRVRTQTPRFPRFLSGVGARARRPVTPDPAPRKPRGRRPPAPPAVAFPGRLSCSAFQGFYVRGREGPSSDPPTFISFTCFSAVAGRSGCADPLLGGGRKQDFSPRPCPRLPFPGAAPDGHRVKGRGPGTGRGPAARCQRRPEGAGGRTEDGDARSDPGLLPRRLPNAGLVPRSWCEAGGRPCAGPSGSGPPAPGLVPPTVPGAPSLSPRPRGRSRAAAPSGGVCGDVLGAPGTQPSSELGPRRVAAAGTQPV